MKQFFLALCCFFSINSFASVMFTSVDQYTCSNGKKYDVAIHNTGGWGPGQWIVIGFCDVGTLTKESYNGRYMPATNASPELKQCAIAISDSIVACYNEFENTNGSSGKGFLEEVESSFEVTSNIGKGESTDSPSREATSKSSLFERIYTDSATHVLSN
jgi:hypothetical protein